MSVHERQSKVNEPEKVDEAEYYSFHFYSTPDVLRKLGLSI